MHYAALSGRADDEHGDEENEQHHMFLEALRNKYPGYDSTLLDEWATAMSNRATGVSVSSPPEGKLVFELWSRIP